jgi:two-component system osmolarity sensor histidine kinase EnvZ
MLKTLKKLIPTSLFFRFFLIIIIPTIVVQLLATYIFYERHWNAVHGYMITSLVGEVITVAEILENDEITDKFTPINEIKENLGLTINFYEGKKLGIKNKHTKEEFKPLYIDLDKKFDNDFDIKYINEGSDIKMDLQLSEGLLSVSFSRKRVDTPTTYIFILWMTGTAAVFLVVALIFSRNQIRPITRLAAAAEKFGKGQQITDFKPEGAKEVRKAAIAFLQMKSRIERQITKRTEMLAGVSHDLRTPLTRLKLELAMLQESKDVKAMQEDIVEMEHMIQSYLDFTKGEGKETSVKVNIKEVIETILNSYKKSSVQITLQTIPSLVLHLKINAFKRAICNFIDNACRYGNIIEISVESDDDSLILYIEDNGPGIPEDKREQVFKAFYRLDTSRNTETGGVGLGMTIARDIINSHGGEVKLSRSKKLGGLLVKVSLPI